VPRAFHRPAAGVQVRPPISIVLRQKCNRICFRYSDVVSVAKAHMDLLLDNKIHAFEHELVQWRSRFLHDKKLLQQWQKCTRSGRWPDINQTLKHNCFFQLQTPKPILSFEKSLVTTTTTAISLSFSTTNITNIVF
jgi:hypothetical protein